MSKTTKSYPEPLENVIEWCNGDKYITCTLREKKYIKMIQKIHANHQNLVPIFNENNDGSVFVRISKKVLKLSIKTTRMRTKSDQNEDNLQKGESV